jgi:hypothetical protein
MTNTNPDFYRYSPAELQRLADIERAKYLRAMFGRLFARWSGRQTAVATPALRGAKA